MPSSDWYVPTSSPRACDRLRSTSSSVIPPAAKSPRSASMAFSASPVLSVTTLAHDTT